MGKILVIDDDEDICKTFHRLISYQGHDVDWALTAQDGLSKARDNEYDVVFLDIVLTDKDGLSIMSDIQATGSRPEIIIITGYPTGDRIEFAFKGGAMEFIKKPIKQAMLISTLNDALERKKRRQSETESTQLKREGIIGNGQKMTRCMKQVAKAARNKVDVLLTGETGTGKELIARAIHDNSDRAENAYIVLDCTNFPPTLIESELFGYEKGAFSGADSRKEGLILKAHGGTLFLDEIAELPLELQNRFLRVLQERRFRPIGGTEEFRSDFRLVSATHRDLKKMLKDHTFREDLYYRISKFPIDVPPLRERGDEDIKALVDNYISIKCLELGTTRRVSDSFLEAVVKFSWPGNVRQLIEAVDRSIADSSDKEALRKDHLPEEIRIQLAKSKIKNEGDGKIIKFKEAQKSAAAQAGRECLQEALSASEGNIDKACELAGISRPQMYKLMKKYGLSAADYRNKKKR